MMKTLLILLALVAPIHASWVEPTYFILDQPLDYVTIRQKHDGYVLTYRASDNKWIAAAGGSSSGGVAVKTDGTAQGTATTMDFTNGIKASTTATAGTFNVSPTYGATANTITQGDDARHNVAPAAGTRGNLSAVNAAGTAYTPIDEGTATDQALMSLGANTPGAFRALIATDIDELLSLSQLTDVTATTGTGTTVPFATSPTLTTPILNNPTINNTGTSTTVLHGNSAGASQFAKVVAADATVTGTGDTFVMSASPAISGTLTCPILTNGGAATVKIDETNGLELRTDAGANGSTVIPGAATLTLNIDGANGALVIATGDSLKTDSLLTTSGGSLFISETSGLSLQDDVGAASTVMNLSPSANALTFSGPGASIFTIGTGEFLRVDKVQTTGGSVLQIQETSGLSLQIDAGTNGSTLVPSASALTINVDGSGQLVITAGDGLSVDTIQAATTNGDLTIQPNGTGDEVILPASKYVKLTGQSGDPAAFNAGGVSYDTTKKSPRFKNGVQGVSPVVGLFAEIADKTVSNPGTSATALGTPVSFPATSFGTGTVIRCQASGRYGISAAGTIDLRITVGGTAGVRVGGMTAGSQPSAGIATNEPWSIDAYITVRDTVDSATTTQGGGSVFFRDSAAVLKIFGSDVVGTTADFSATKDVGLIVNFGGSDANDTITATSIVWTMVTP